MIAHVVGFKMKPFANGKNQDRNLDELIEKLEILKTIPVVRAMYVERNEKGSEYAAVLTELFSDEAALDEYENNPTHLGIKDYIFEICEDMFVENVEF